MTVQAEWQCQHEWGGSNGTSRVATTVARRGKSSERVGANDGGTAATITCAVGLVTKKSKGRVSLTGERDRGARSKTGQGVDGDGH